MDVFCAGMYRAGSTWQYNIAAALLERHGGRRGGVSFGEDFAPSSDSWRVLKTHDAHPAFGAALEAGQAIALYCFRDLRDVAFSLVHKFAVPFEELIERRGWLKRCLVNDAFWTRQARTLCQRYEHLIADPAAAVVAIAGHLGISLGNDEAKALAAEYSWEANRQRAQELESQLRAAGVDLNNSANALRWDERTLLHWNHLRQGRIGGWRDEATPRQVRVLARSCGRWLVERGYESDLSWSRPARRDWLSDWSEIAARLRFALRRFSRVLGTQAP